MKKSKPVIVGSGVYNYDIIVQREYPDGFVKGRRNRFTENVLSEEVGGTCGNVMCILAHLGWDSKPQAQFDESEYGRHLKADLEKYGCDTSFVELIPNGGTVILRCTHKLDKDTGEHTASFRATGPTSIFAKRKQLRIKDEVEPFISSLGCTADVYFFDSPEAGPRAIATDLRTKGTLIYFEPESDKEKNKFLSAVRISDIVKFSGEKIKDLSICSEFKNKLFIRTQGADGIDFSLHGSAWEHIPPVAVSKVVDWEGCGDTTTAVFLDTLAKLGALDITKMTTCDVRSALETASEKAALCTQFMGSKGWINQVKIKSLLQ